MVLASPVSSAASQSTTVLPTSPRSGRFRRLTYLRNHSQSDNQSRNQDVRYQPILPPPPSSVQNIYSSPNDPYFATPITTPIPDPGPPTSGWLPASQPTTQLHPTAAMSLEQSADLGHEGTRSNMTRRRSATTPAVVSQYPIFPSTGRNRSGNTVESQVQSPPASASQQNTRAGFTQMPCIRFVNYQDSRACRPSLSFPTILRTLPRMESVIRVGRYSEKDAPPESVGEGPSDAPVGFKSKVVSRKHCEFSFKDSHWWIKDTKSSSGTFLNRIRLSQPNTESKPYKLNDGDIVQLGIDFKGGEESIFRCVKIRIYCNKSWQQKKNNFNTSTHKQLQQLTKIRSADAAAKDSTDCTICLCPIAPCQALFIAPCSHNWHYKCIRPIIMEHGDYHYPEFLCPNCRAVADLEEDIEESEPWEESESFDDEAGRGHAGEEADIGLPVSDEPDSAHQTSEDEDFATEIGYMTLRDRTESTGKSGPSEQQALNDFSSPSSRNSLGPLNPDASTFVPLPSSISRPHGGRFPDWSLPGWQSSSPMRTFVGPAPLGGIASEQRAVEKDEESTNPLANVRTVTPGSVQTYAIGENEGPITPRNNAGPFLFDGVLPDIEVERSRQL